jgi:hypothetical protein
MQEYVSGSKASSILGVHQRTLYLWDEKKLIDVIRTPGGKRLYNVKKYLADIELKKDSIDDTPKRIYNIKKKGSTVKDDVSNTSSLINVLEKEDSIPRLSDNVPENVSIDNIDCPLEKDFKQNYIFAYNQSKQLIEKYPKHLLISGETSLNKFLDLIIDNKIREVVIDKNEWNIDSYNMLLYLFSKFSDGSLIGENNIKQINDPTDMQLFIKMMGDLIKKQ